MATIVVIRRLATVSSRREATREGDARASTYIPKTSYVPLPPNFLLCLCPISVVNSSGIIKCDVLQGTYNRICRSRDREIIRMV
jgi:hypothetical protein